MVCCSCCVVFVGVAFFDLFVCAFQCGILCAVVSIVFVVRCLLVCGFLNKMCLCVLCVNYRVVSLSCWCVCVCFR